ncbi:MAG: polyhydroxyalkanoate synthesis regulator DNA-binding domain-containing protein [Phycisphaerales bacterium]
MSDPQFIQIRKYPNRRLYDLTRSRHLTHEELYDLVAAGRTVNISDARSGADITNLVLLQALMERTPEKFAAFPPELSHLLIRAGEQMLRSAAASWFTQIIRGVAPFVPGGANAAAPATPAAPRSAADAEASAPRGAPAGGASLEELQARLAALAQEVEALRGPGKRRSRS